MDEWFVFMHYLPKCLDWFDPFWILMKKSQQKLSFLHVFYHTTIGMVWGYLLRAGVGSDTIQYGALAISPTHVIMYSPYVGTSLGLKNPIA